MTLLRAIRDDLVEKRLWPVALILVAALVALPVLVGRGAEPSAAPLPDPGLAASPVNGTAATPVQLVENVPNQRPTGRFKDPFRGSASDSEAEPGSASAPLNVATTVTPDPARSGGSAPSTSTSAGSGTPTDTPVFSDPGYVPSTDQPDGPDGRPVPAPTRAADGSYEAGYRVDVRWGPTSDPQAVRDLPRLGALMAGEQPHVVLLGVRADGKTAVFMIVSGASATGDGRCRPTLEMCSIIELRKGDTEFLDVPTPEGIVQYELYVERIASREVYSAAAAERWLDRFSKAGRTAVKEAIAGGRTFARRFVYAPSRGILLFSTRGTGDGAKAGTSSAAAAGELQIAQ